MYFTASDREEWPRIAIEVVCQFRRGGFGACFPVPQLPQIIVSKGIEGPICENNRKAVPTIKPQNFLICWKLISYACGNKFLLERAITQLPFLIITE